MQPRVQPLRSCFVAAGVLVALAGLLGPAAADDAKLNGIVLDYSPRQPDEVKPAIRIKQNGEALPLREHQIVYIGDSFVFDDGLKPDAFVTVLIGSNTPVKLQAANPDLPSHTWPALQALAPSLVAAYRWINPAKSREKPVLSNAISRGDEMLSMLPHVTAKLIISNRGTTPLWLGWTGGKPPFSVSAASGGKTLSELRVCDQGSPPACVREALINAPVVGEDPLTIVITSADGGSLPQTLSRSAVKPGPIAARADDLGNLGRFLEATELLDRGHGEYVLESARLLAAIAKDYPPARILLDRIRDGDVP